MNNHELATKIYEGLKAHGVMIENMGILIIENIITETDWSTVPVDAKVRVRGKTDMGDVGLKRHFAKWENGAIYTWDLGETSWTAPDNKAIHSTTSSWSPDKVELVEA